VRAGETVEPIEIRLDRGVPCAGTVHVADASDGEMTLYINGADGENVVTSVELRGGRGTFRVFGLSPGKQRVFLLGAEREYALVEFTLGPEGYEALELEFRAR
jgi:hypothetical protein